MSPPSKAGPWFSWAAQISVCQGRGKMIAWTRCSSTPRQTQGANASYACKKKYFVRRKKYLQFIHTEGWQVCGAAAGQGSGGLGTRWTPAASWWQWQRSPGLGPGADLQNHFIFLLFINFIVLTYIYFPWSWPKSIFGWPPRGWAGGSGWRGWGHCPGWRLGSSWCHRWCWSKCPLGSGGRLGSRDSFWNMTFNVKYCVNFCKISGKGRYDNLDHNNVISMNMFRMVITNSKLTNIQ